jgi:hypothetical protein
LENEQLEILQYLIFDIEIDRTDKVNAIIEHFVDLQATVENMFKIRELNQELQSMPINLEMKNNKVKL